MESVDSECAQGCDPEDSQGIVSGCCGSLFGFGKGFSDGSEPCGQSFPGAGGGVNQPGVSGEVMLPCLQLEGEDGPVPLQEPIGDGLQRGVCGWVPWGCLIRASW